MNLEKVEKQIERKKETWNTKGEKLTGNKRSNAFGIATGLEMALELIEEEA